MSPRSAPRLDSPDKETDRRPAAYFEAAHRAFLAAQDAAGTAEQTFAIAEYQIRLRFAGEVMIPAMTRALSHLAVQPTSPPDLTVCIWDSASTKTATIPPPWPVDDRAVQGLIQWSDTHRFQTLLQPQNRTLDMLDHRRDIGIHWIPDADCVPVYETVSPLRTLLYWWMRRHGRQLVHAGAVGTVNGGVLLPARSGSGKSTTALACLTAGLLCAGDDKVLLTTDVQPVRAYSMYSSAALHGSHLRARFSHLVSFSEDPDPSEQEKAFTFLWDRYPDQLPASLPVRAVLVPQVTGHRDTQLSRSTAATSLRALVPSTVFSLPGAGRETFEILTKLVRPLPHYTLHLGTDLSQIPRVISDLLRTLP